MAYNGTITWEFAAALTLGSNIGSTIDAVLASFGTSTDAKRSAFIHVLFNVVGTFLALIFFEPFLKLVTFCTPGGENSNIAIRISMLHTIFKALSTLIMIPFVNQIVRLSQLVIKEKEVEASGVYKLEFHETTGKESITSFVIRAEKAISDMTDVVTNMFDRIQIGFSKRNKDFVEEQIPLLTKEEDYVDQMHEQLTHYLVKCEALQLTQKQISHISAMIQIVDELENMSDGCYATICLIVRSIEKKMSFKQEDMERMLPYVELGRQFLQFVQRNINKHIDESKLQLANELENGIDITIKEAVGSELIWIEEDV